MRVRSRVTDAAIEYYLQVTSLWIDKRPPQFKEASTSLMTESNPSNPTSPRPVLKLKASAQKSVRADKTPPPRVPAKPSQKPGAAWSDEFKRRMQEDMDALISR
jgi:hypothetical protein